LGFFAGHHHAFDEFPFHFLEELFWEECLPLCPEDRNLFFFEKERYLETFVKKIREYIFPADEFI